jgi:hypothetical protein
MDYTAILILLIVVSIVIGLISIWATKKDVETRNEEIKTYESILIKYSEMKSEEDIRDFKKEIDDRYKVAKTGRTNYYLTSYYLEGVLKGIEISNKLLNK